MKICKDCKHQYRTGGFDAWSFGVYVACDYHKKLHPVFGTPLYNVCSKMREPGGECGPEGKLWETKEPKQKPDSFWEFIKSLS